MAVKMERVVVVEVVVVIASALVVEAVCTCETLLMGLVGESQSLYI